ncbi:5-formyltetrahydrofolate cyclo-ligase [Sulfurospirillum sp. 1307]
MIENKKIEFRKEAKKRVLYFTKQNKIKRDKYVVNHLEELIKKGNFKNILLYIPLASEVDTMPLINKIRQKVNVYVPFMEGKSFKMVKFRLPLFKKKFSIREPKNSFARISKIDLAIVPVLGVDGAFRRIGFGKGMYDRFFESLKSSPLVAFVQLGECIVKEKICQSHDIRANFYITPYKIINTKGRNVCRHKCSSSRSYSRCGRVFNSKKIRFSKS